MRKFGFAVAACAACSVGATAEVVIDAVGDFLPTYTVADQNPDLDVVSSEVTLDVVAETVTFSGTHAGAIGQTPGALYVWGLDRGQGTERFQTSDPAIGEGVFFDSVLVLRPDGTGVFNDFINGIATPLDAGDVLIDGGTIASAALPLSLFPSTGLSPEHYTWNLWPRVGLGANNQISDFAPDARNASLTVVPEPGALGLLTVAVIGALGRRR